MRRLGDGGATDWKRASVGGAPAPRRPAARTTDLRPEAVRTRDVRVIGLELGVQPARRPAGELRHALPDRLGAVLPLAAAGPDARSSEQHVLQRDGHLVLYGVVQLGDDVGVGGAQPLGPARHLAGEIEHPRPAAAVRRYQGLERVAAESGGRRLARDVEPRVRLPPWRLVVGAVEGDPLAPALAATAERAHDLVTQLLGQAPEARELGAGDRQEAPALLGDDLVRARHVGLALALLVRKRTYAGVRVHDLVQRDARVGQDLAHLAQEIGDLVAGRVQTLEVAVEIGVGRADQRELAPRDHEDHAVVAGRVIDGAVGEPRHEAVDALRPSESPRAALGDAGGRAELVHPRAGRGDHDARAQGRDATGQDIPPAHARDHAPLA